MKGLAIKTLLAFLALAILAGGEAAAAARRKKVKESRANLGKAYALNDIMKAPDQYLEQEVFFYCRFASATSLFKPINTPYNSHEFSNFAAWPDKAALWIADDARNVLPTLYISKRETDLLDILRMLEKHELIAVTGKVTDKYGGYPWILVRNIERVEMPKDRLSDTTVQHMRNGAEALAGGNGGAAARHFETALKFGLPPEYYNRAYEQLAMSYLLIDDLPKAQEYLRLATETGKGDAALHLALADVCLRMDEPEEAIAHCVFAIEKSGKLPQVYGMKGEAKAVMGDYGGAFGDINAAAGTPGITSREKAMLEVRRARIYVRAERYADAARVYAAVSEQNTALGSESWLHNEVGLFYESMYLQTGDARYLDSAYSAYEQAASFGKSNPAVLYNQAEVEYRRQVLSETFSFDKVHEILNRIEALDPEYVPGRVLLGRVLFNEGRQEEANRLYDTFKDRIGDDPMALMALAEAYHDQGDDTSASMLISRAMAVQPWNLRLKALGESYLARGGGGAGTPFPTAAPAQPPRPAAMPSQPQTRTYERYDDGPPQQLGGRPAAGSREKVIAVGPGDVIRIERAGAAWTADGGFQTSAPPESVVGWQMDSYPAGEVRLETQPPFHAGGDLRPPGIQGSAARQSAVVPKGRHGVSPLDLGYYPSEAPVAGTARDENEIGYAPRSELAFASVSDPEKAAPHVPPPFTFSPDESPVIIAGHISNPGGELAAMPVRNVNLHRGHHKRRPAEIIEEDARHLTPRDDAAFAMVPPDRTASGAPLRPTLRTEVVLPSSTRGIGADDKTAAGKAAAEDSLLPAAW
ncbi:MAG: hypothetical protein LBT97_08755 [Planctomycetota bacterium]|jgi:tetratricopeptide (TPR) repeat protein|nr:hypothetical protein [Planctomycetota bacterium]